jgi:hypothetical protein
MSKNKKRPLWSEKHSARPRVGVASHASYEFLIRQDQCPNLLRYAVRNTALLDPRSPDLFENVLGSLNLNNGRRFFPSLGAHSIASPLGLRHSSVMRTPIALPPAIGHRSSTMQRRRFKHILSFPDRLAEEAERLRAEAEKLPHGQSGICV